MFANAKSSSEAHGGIGIRIVSYPGRRHTWMTKLLPAILPMLLALSSSLVASMTPRPVAYSLPCEP